MHQNSVSRFIVCPLYKTGLIHVVASAVAHSYADHTEGLVLLVLPALSMLLAVVFLFLLFLFLFSLVNFNASSI